MELSQNTKQVLFSYQQWYQNLEPKGDTATIGVDEVASKVASFYEKIRGVVDWREEHLLRKTAIERMLKRRFFVNGDAKEMGESLLQELIRGGHFPNNRIPVGKIDEIQRIINKYAFLAENGKDDWVLSVAASEIEETLIPPLKEKALIAFMAQEMEERIKLRDKDRNKITQENQNLLIFIAVEKALFKVDDSTIALHLLERFYQNWNVLPVENLAQIAANLSETKTKIQGLLAHPMGERFYQIAEHYDTPYLILGDIISQDPNNFLALSQNPQEFESAINRFYNIRLQKLKTRTNRAAFFSTLSVFLSKVLIALAIEIPVDRYITNQLNSTALLISIAVPPLFLLFLIWTVRSSSQENRQRVLIEIGKITFENERKDTYTVALPKMPRGTLGFFVQMVYALTFFITFGFLVLILKSYSFSALSIVVFLLFFSLVTYAGMRIRHRSRELMIGEIKQGFSIGILDFFLLPVIQVGQWLSRQLPRYNVIVILLNVLIEAPFQVFVEFIEQLRTFWKQKKEEIH